MRPDPRACLWDVQQAAAAIDAFTEGLDDADHRRNALVRAVIGFRNMLIHGYATIGHDRV